MYRQENILKRHGVDLPRANLANWIIKAGELLTPIINLLNDQLLAGPLIHMDETPVQVSDEPDKPPQSKSYMWIRVGGTPEKQVRLFDYAPTRSGQIPVSLLQDYSGFLLTDGYEGYNAVVKQNQITPLACWAHVRRKFDEALKAQPQKTGKAQMALSLIQKLYAIEKAIYHLKKNSFNADKKPGPFSTKSKTGCLSPLSKCYPNRMSVKRFTTCTNYGLNSPFTQKAAKPKSTTTQLRMLSVRL